MVDCEKGQSEDVLTGYKKCKKVRPKNLKYGKISQTKKLNIIYNDQVLQLDYKSNCRETDTNYHSIRHIVNNYKKSLRPSINIECTKENAVTKEGGLNTTGDLLKR